MNKTCAQTPGKEFTLNGTSEQRFSNWTVGSQCSASRVRIRQRSALTLEKWREEEKSVAKPTGENERQEKKFSALRGRMLNVSIFSWVHGEKVFLPFVKRMAEIITARMALNNMINFPFSLSVKKNVKARIAFV